MCVVLVNFVIDVVNVSCRINVVLTLVKFFIASLAMLHDVPN